MSLPGTSVIFRRTNTAPNPQDLSAFACVVGYSSLGVRNKVMTLGSLAARANAGNGEGVEQAAEIGLSAGWPVYLCPVEGARQSPGAVTKTSASAGVPKIIYGSALAPGGTPPAGGILYTAKTSGVSVVQVSGGANGVVVSGPVGAKIVTVTYAVAATNTTIAGLVTADMAASALVSATAVGGSGAVGPLASTLLDNGSLTATPLAAGVTYSVVYSGTSTPLGIPAVVGSAVVINGATTVDGLPASTPAQIKTFLDTDAGAGAVAARALLTLAAGGTGAGLASAASTTALQFGSTGAMTASGTGVDSFSFVLRILTPGTVGGSPNPSMQWSADGGITYSSKTLIPASGIVALKDSVLDTGISVTFTGTLEASGAGGIPDSFAFSVAKPIVAPVDLEAGIAAAILDTTRQFGYLTSPSSVSRTTGVDIDTKLQATKTIRFLRGLFNARAIGEGVPNETEASWVNSLNAEWTGFVSTDGPLWMAAGNVSHVSGYTGRVYQRPAVVPISGRRSASAMHQSLGETAMGALPRINFSVDPVTGGVTDRGIDHDERRLPGLSDNRFITLRTYAERSDSEFWVTNWPTMADPSDAGHALGMYVNVLFEAAREAKRALFVLIQKPAEGIATAESAQVPAGAISRGDAARTESFVGGAVNALIFKPKSDDLPSASPLPPDQKTIQVLRNYDYIKTRELRTEMTIRPLGYNEAITLGVTLELP